MGLLKVNCHAYLTFSRHENKSLCVPGRKMQMQKKVFDF